MTVKDNEILDNFKDRKAHIAKLFSLNGEIKILKTTIEQHQEKIMALEVDVQKMNKQKEFTDMLYKKLKIMYESSSPSPAECSVEKQVLFL